MQIESIQRLQEEVARAQQEAARRAAQRPIFQSNLPLGAGQPAAPATPPQPQVRFAPGLVPEPARTPPQLRTGRAELPNQRVGRVERMPGQRPAATPPPTTPPPPAGTPPAAPRGPSWFNRMRARLPDKTGGLAKFGAATALAAEVPGMVRDMNAPDTTWLDKGAIGGERVGRAASTTLGAIGGGALLGPVGVIPGGLLGYAAPGMAARLAGRDLPSEMARQRYEAAGETPPDMVELAGMAGDASLRGAEIYGDLAAGRPITPAEPRERRQETVVDESPVEEVAPAPVGPFVDDGPGRTSFQERMRELNPPQEMSGTRVVGTGNARRVEQTPPRVVDPMAPGMSRMDPVLRTLGQDLQAREAFNTMQAERNSGIRVGVGPNGEPSFSGSAGMVDPDRLTQTPSLTTMPDGAYAARGAANLGSARLDAARRAMASGDMETANEALRLFDGGGREAPQGPRVIGPPRMSREEYNAELQRINNEYPSSGRRSVAQINNREIALGRLNETFYGGPTTVVDAPQDPMQNPAVISEQLRQAGQDRRAQMEALKGTPFDPTDFGFSMEGIGDQARLVSKSGVVTTPEMHMSAMAQWNQIPEVLGRQPTQGDYFDILYELMGGRPKETE